MEQIRQLIQAEGGLAEGPGAYDFGQGHLALRETPGELYREGWEEHLQLSELKRQELKNQELAMEFRDQALVYLRLGAGEMPEPSRAGPDRSGGSPGSEPVPIQGI